MKTELELRFEENIDKYKLIEHKDTIIVGASGGPDSMALIYLLSTIIEDYDLKIILAHLNHLHRQEASYDEGLVSDLAKNLGLDFRVRRFSMDEKARELKISPEDAGRRLRYEFFNDLASEYENAKIAVAHIMDDQAETIIMRMIRGTGLVGLGAMDFKSNNIIRPILNFKKTEILNFLTKKNIRYAIDQTNLETDYTRNFIRHEIIPKMEEVNPKAIENIFTMTELLRDDMEILDAHIKDIYNKVLLKSGDGFIQMDREKFEALSYSYQTRLIILAIRELENEFKDFSKENIDGFVSLVDLQTGKKIIKDDLVFEKNYKSYQLKKLKSLPTFDDNIHLNLGDELTFAGFKIRASLVDEVGNKGPNVGYFDYDKLKFPLVVRKRKAGDKFIPQGFGHSKKLKDFFIDSKIDSNKRDGIPIIASDDEIIWVAPFRQAEVALVDKTSTKILKIEVKDDI